MIMFRAASIKWGELLILLARPLRILRKLVYSVKRTRNLKTVTLLPLRFVQIHIAETILFSPFTYPLGM